MSEKVFRCKSCKAAVPVRDVHHAGKGDEGFLYCDRDGTALTFCIYDEAYRDIVGRATFPFALTEGQKQDVERRLIACPCGGEFSFKNPLRCPVCGGVFSEPMAFSHSEIVVILDRHVDGNKTWIWKHKPSEL